ncbi:MAG: MraY family glycosyltransferase [Bryobacteraceae bacterium]
MLILFDAAAIAFFLALLLTPFVRDAARKWGFVDQPDGRRKLHSRPIPRVGGVAIVLAYVASFGLLSVLPYGVLPFDLSRAADGGLRLLPAVGLVFLTGLWDDLRGLKPWQKIAGQTLAALLAYLCGFGIEQFRGFELNPALSLIVTVAWLVGCSNAVNLLDGMDGLAAGVGFFAATTTVIAALIQNNAMLAIATAPLAGALLGFLRYNFNPASVFLGDSGSLLVGFLLGAFGLIWTTKSATVLGMTAPMMALAIPLLDAGLAVVRRAMRNQPIWAGDRGHIHHRLLAAGLTPRRAALLLYAACGLTAAFSLLQEASHNRYGGVILVIFCATVWIGIQHLGYSEFGIARRLVFRGTFRGIIDVESRLVELKAALAKATDLHEAWSILSMSSLEFGFSSIEIEPRNASVNLPAMGEPGAGHWRLEVPLAEGSRLLLYRPAEGEIHPVTLSAFAQVAQGVLESRLASSRAETNPQQDRPDTQVPEPARKGLGAVA